MALFSEKSLNLMPTSVLTGLSNSLVLQKGEKEVLLATKNVKIQKLQGISTVRTPANGRITVATGGVPAATARAESMATPAKSYANGASLMNSTVGNPSGAPVFVPGTVPANTTSDDVDAMTSEINSYFSETTPGPATLANAKVSALQQERVSLQNEINQINATLDQIALIIEGRAAGDLPNPSLNISALDAGVTPPGVAARIEKAVQDNVQYVSNQIVAPFLENQRLLQSLVSEASGGPGDAPVFDLEFGPPISTRNNFVLSRDGLYYDSRTAEVPNIVPQPTSAGMWDLQYDSNKGGRGLSFSEADGEDTAGTIFDLNVNIDRNSRRVQQFFKYDDVLQQFEDDKQSQMTEVSGYIAEILANGYGRQDAVVQSYVAQLGAVANVYDVKIEKRKRQLAIAAYYGRDVFFVTGRNHPVGEGLFFKYEPLPGKSFEYKLQYKELPDKAKSVSFLELESGQTLLYDTKTNAVVDNQRLANILAKQGNWTQIPRVPINDFSYLKETDIPLQVQKKITLFSEDLDTIIAPFQARYVVAPPNVPNTSVESLAVDMIGYGDWVHRETSGSLSATTPLYKSLTDDIVSEDLLICYNFLDPDAITEPSGTLYALNNAAEGSTRLDAKLVGYDKSFVFPSGVGQAYMGGTIFNERASMNGLWEDVKGSYVRLPNITKDYVKFNTPFRGSNPLDNLFYTKNGVTFDFWAYVPNVHKDMTDYHRYRLVLANENSGPVNASYVAASTQTKLKGSNGVVAGGTDLNRTIGFMMGWRDQGSPSKTGTYSPSGLEFFLAPTVGQNQISETNPNKSWGHSVCIAERWDADIIGPKQGDVTQVGMFIPSSVTNSSGTQIGDVSSGYHHFNIAFDYESDEVRFNLDGELLRTSSIGDVLGGNPNDTVLPTAVSIDRANNTDVIHFNDPTAESFLGNTIYDERVTPERVAFPVFTPWIIGGGYSDTMPKVPGSDYRPMGFLGSNTNNTHQNLPAGTTDVSTVTINGGDFIVGQHQPPLSNSKLGTSSSLRKIPRSGLDGFVGSFKIYSKPLTTNEAKENYRAQRGFFKNILLS